MQIGRYFCPILTNVEFSWKNAPGRQVRDEDIESKLISDTDWAQHVEDTESEEEEYGYGGE